MLKRKALTWLGLWGLVLCAVGCGEETVEPAPREENRLEDIAAVAQRLESSIQDMEYQHSDIRLRQEKISERVRVIRTEGNSLSEDLRELQTSIDAWERSAVEIEGHLADLRFEIRNAPGGKGLMASAPPRPERPVQKADSKAEAKPEPEVEEKSGGMSPLLRIALGLVVLIVIFVVMMRLWDAKEAGANAGESTTVRPPGAANSEEKMEFGAIRFWSPDGPDTQNDLDESEDEPPGKSAPKSPEE